MVEAALGRPAATDCVVIVEESSEAEVRFANNTTTTNGLRRSRRVTAISFWEVDGGVAAGVARRSGDVDVADLVRAAEADAAGSPAAEDAAPLVGGAADGDFGEPPISTDLSVLSGVLGDLGGAFGRAEQAERVLAGFAEHSVSTIYLGTSTGLRHRHAQPTGALHLVARSTDGVRSAWAGAGTVDFADVTVDDLEERLARRLGWARRRVDLEAGRYEVLLPPEAVADLMVDLVEAASRQDAEDGRTVFSSARRRHRPGRRALGPSLRAAQRPARAPGSSAPRSWPSGPRGPTSRSSTTGCRSSAPTGSPTGGSAGCATTGPAPARSGVPVAPPIDNLVLELPGADGLGRRPGGPHRAGSAAHLPVVHPRGRPRPPCSSPGSPATASTWSRTAR